MKKIGGKIRRGVGFISDIFGTKEAIIYLLGFIGSITGGGVSFLLYFLKGVQISFIFGLVSIFILIIAGTAFLLIKEVRRKTWLGKKLNPYIWIDEWLTEINILYSNKEVVSAYRTDTIKLFAVHKGVSQYKIKISKRSGEIITLIKDGIKNAHPFPDLHGDPEWENYILEFREPLKIEVEKAIEIILPWKIENLAAHISQTFANCAGFSRWRLILNYPKNLIAEGTLFKVRKYTMIGETIDRELAEVRQYKDGLQVVWEIEDSPNIKTRENIWYRLEWVWQ